MSQPIDEQISALLDDELPEVEEALLLRRLELDDSYRDTLVRYAFIGELVRGAVPVPGLRSLGTRVRAAVAEETQVTALAGAGRRRAAGLGLVAVAAAAVILLSQTATNPEPELAQELATSARLVASSVQPQPAAIPPRARLAPSRLTAYLVSHGNYANGLSWQVMNSHVVNRSPEYLLTSYSQGPGNE